MVLDHLEEPERPHAEGERRDADDDPDGRVQRQRQGAAAENARGQKPRQAHVAERPFHERDGEDQHDEAGAHPEGRPPVPSAAPPAEERRSPPTLSAVRHHRDAREHLQREDDLLDRHHAGEPPAEAVEGEQAPEHVELGAPAADPPPVGAAVRELAAQCTRRAARPGRAVRAGHSRMSGPPATAVRTALDYRSAAMEKLS